ncbi:MAG: RelA/SpoT domain-containing protein [Chloroflexi bacterium]|nr:RelA/SpoT domain-containing protein [Chloroflexota bacterium]
MNWAVSTHSKEDIDAAGRILISKRSSDDEKGQAISIINNWRAAHAFPLNTLQMRLRTIAGDTDRKSLVSQRIKRLSAIESKLRRLRNVTLSTMQDIGGCRAVVDSADLVYKLEKKYKSGRARHDLDKENDYIHQPTNDGYRSIHLIYKYVSDGSVQYNGQRIEVQLRSRLQHAWATAVEIVDIFANQLLKVNQGDEVWERFFALMSSYIAFQEKTPIIPSTPDNKNELVKELCDKARVLHVKDRLLAIKTIRTSKVLRKGSGYYYYLLDLDMEKRKLSITPYKRSQAQEASTKTAELELAYRSKSHPNKDVLLVHVPSFNELKRAYPNYFADTDVFLDELDRAFSESC